VTEASTPPNRRSEDETAHLGKACVRELTDPAEPAGAREALCETVSRRMAQTVATDAPVSVFPWQRWSERTER
jgi:hypothetical protein